MIVEEITEIIRNTPYDTSIPQTRLDLTNKLRTSLFPWRGQFSPELIEVFLDQYARAGAIVLDPFAGSGTTLFEAVRKGFRCYGSEINPSAFEMAKTVHMANLLPAERKTYFQKIEALAEKYLSPFNRDLFSAFTENEEPDLNFHAAEAGVIKKLAQEANEDTYMRNIMANTIIKYMACREPRSPNDFFRTLHEYARIVASIPYQQEAAKVFHCDARSIPLADHSIDLIITSPPYINVFNYHQNNRPAMELLGWNLLDIAKSEIGSNRKNRQNRFLTVIQYALDMLDALVEMKRLLKPDGRAIIVIGKESSVRGTSFKNGTLVASLAIGGAGFRLTALQTRKFTNKFGETIYEDVLHLTPDSEYPAYNSDIARSIALWHLSQATALDQAVQLDILDARQKAPFVQKSPLLDIPTFPDNQAHLADIQ